jgi:hypothetical protein
MTERGPLAAGRRGRWYATLAVAPTAAALFAATTAWSATHDPTPPAPTATPTNGADVAAMQRTLDDETARVSALQTQVSQLRTLAAALGKGSAPATTKAPAAARSNSGGTPARASGGTTTRTAPRPPVVHAVTGGS